MTSSPAPTGRSPSSPSTMACCSRCTSRQPAGWAAQLDGVQPGIPARSQAEVDRLLGQAEAAGATLTAPAHMRPFGVYSGYFTDPDGHLFEIAWNSNE